jgi:hypothetical protein
MALYWNLAGLRATAKVEGGTGYTAKDPNSSASGAYSFLDSTWKTYQTQYNQQYGTSYSYTHARDAPPQVQDQVASITPVSNWGGSWAGSGGANAANPALTQSTPLSPSTFTSPYGVAFDQQSGGANFTPPANTPDYLCRSSPAGAQNCTPLDGAPTGGSTGGDPNADFTYNDPNAGSGGTGAPTGGSTGATGGTGGTGTGQPVTVGLQPGFVSTVGGWISGAETAVGNQIKSIFTTLFGSAINWFERAILILIGLVILAIALYRIADPSGAKTQTLLAMAAK